MNKSTCFCILTLILLNCKTYGQYHYYYGTIHTHSSYSDGNKDSAISLMTTPYQDYQYAKHSLHMDYLGISEHNHYTAGLTLANFHKGVQQADSANEDGTFVCLYGMEWGQISTGGHVVIYGIDSLIGWENNNYDIYNSMYDYTALFAKLARHPGAFAYFAHPTATDFNNIYTSAFNPVSDSVIIGTPFRSGPAFSTDTVYNNPSTGNYLNRFYDALKKGYHVGIGMDHDTHNTVFGRSQEGRTVVLADTLTQESILDAYRNRRFYASDDWNVKVNFTVNSHPMGQLLTGYGNPTISISVVDPDGESNSSIVVYFGVPGSGIASSILTSNNGSLSLNNTPTIPNGSSYYYYARILQSDGDQIYTSPIWYTRNDNVAVNEFTNTSITDFSITPNPTDGAFIISFTATKQNNLAIEVYDTNGKQVMKEKLENFNGAYAKQLQLQKVTPGMYLLRLVGDGINRSQKLLVH